MKVLKTLLVVSIFLIGIIASAQTKENQKSKKFNQIDSDGNEVVTFSEMKLYYKDKKVVVEDSINVIEIFSRFDTNNSNLITLGEYIEGVKKDLAEELKTEEVSAEAIKNDKSELVEVDTTNYVQTFAVIDVDDNDKLSLNEMLAFYKGKKGKSGKLINAELRFYGLDTNSNGFINLIEFSSKINWGVANRKYKAIKQK